jgi:hypothetical protein
MNEKEHKEYPLYTIVFLKTSVKDTKGVKRKLNGLSLEKMKTKPFCSLTFLYLSVKIVSNVESSKERTRPKEGSKLGYQDFGILGFWGSGV